MTDIPRIHKSTLPNLTAVIIKDVTLWFSYETLVAFQTPSITVVAKNIWSNTTGRQNVWSNTIGRHLNYIDDGDKSTRVDLTELHDMVRLELSH